jgi:four helix bundle protein
MEEDEREPIRGFRDLEVYRRSYKLALEVHRASSCFPQEDRHGVADQLRRAAWSVPANIAEGHGRRMFEKDFKRILVTALGSLNEATVFIDAAHDLGWLPEGQYREWIAQYTILAKQLHVLIQTWRTF